MTRERDAAIVNLTDMRSRLRSLDLLLGGDRVTTEAMFYIDLVLGKILNEPELKIPETMSRELDRFSIQINALTDDFLSKGIPLWKQ